MITAGLIAQQQLLIPSGGGGTLWTPLNMGTVPAIYLHMNESVITDVSGSASAVGNLGSLGSDGDFSQSVSGNRPLILNNELNGKRVLRFDGSNDVLVCASTAARDLFRNKQAAWAFFVYKKRGTDTTATARYLLYAAKNDGAVRFGVLSADSASGRANKPLMYARRLDTDAVAQLDSPNARSGSYVMAMHSATFSTRAGLIRENGSIAASNATLTSSGGATTSDTAAAVGTPLAIGAFHSGALPSDVDLAAVVIGNAPLLAGEAERLEGWAADQWAMRSVLPSDHPYKASPPTI